MNYRLLSRYVGLAVVILGLVMVACAGWALYFGEWLSLQAMLLSGILCAGFGGLLIFLGRQASPMILQREALALVGLVWVVVCVLGGLPFVFGGTLGYVDAVFESASGFTTSGATVIEDIEATSHTLLFWRSFTHWLGGIGIIVLFVAVLPYLGAGGKQLFKTETTGPDPRGLRPRIRDSAKLLFRIYIAFTVCQTIAYMAAGLPLYEALCHTLGGLSTGGFSPKQASIAAYDSVAVEIITIVFMMIGGTSFALFFAMMRGNWFAVVRDTEWRCYIGILIAATIVITLNLMFPYSIFPTEENVGALRSSQSYEAGDALRAASFQVVSIMTTTGYVTEDFDAWPHFSRVLLVTLMFIGGCAGSTGGGIKVVRVVMLIKMVYARLERTFRPKTIRALRINGEVVEEEVQLMVYGFFGLYLVCFLGGLLYLSAVGLPLETAIGAILGTLNNIGPGLEHVGPAVDYSNIPGAGKVFLSFFMILGRLELFSLAVFVLPSFWRVR